KTAKASGCELTVRLQNTGSGTMPVEVDATRGDRFDKGGAASPDYKKHAPRSLRAPASHATSSSRASRARADRRRRGCQGPAASADERDGQALNCSRLIAEGRFGRIDQPAEEEDAAGSRVPNHKDERVVGAEGDDFVTECVRRDVIECGNRFDPLLVQVDRSS